MVLRFVIFVSLFGSNINFHFSSASILRTIQDNFPPPEPYTYESYQRGIKCSALSPPLKPATLSEIQDIIKYTRETNRTVKVVGNLHSVTDLICTKGIVINMTHINHFSYDPRTQRATVGAGATLIDFMQKLHERGRAIESAPSYASITIGGATGTGAHGTSLLHPTSLSDQIFSVTIVDGRGNVSTITTGQEDFKAFRIHLGFLGVIYEVVVNTVEQYKLQIKHFPVEDDILWSGREILDLAENHDMFQFWWFPTNKAVVLSVGNRTSVNQPGDCETHQISEFPKITSVSFSVGLELMQTARDNIGFFLLQSYAKLSLYKSVPLRTPFYTEADGRTPCLPEATGYSHRMMTNECKECFWQQGKLSLLEDDSNIAIPVSELYPALKTLREIFSKQLVSFPLNGLYFRFLKSSDSYVAMNSHRDVVNIEWITNPRFNRSQPKLGLAAHQAMGQALIRKHGGRPHWGKNGLMYHHPHILQQVHPQLGMFIKAMEKYDPDHIFMNDFGARIRLGRNQMTARKDMLERCGLNELCVCQNDQDCGSGGPLAHTCGDLLGNRVCMPRPNSRDESKASLARKVINSIPSRNNEGFTFNLMKVVDFNAIKSLGLHI